MAEVQRQIIRPKTNGTGQFSDNPIIERLTRTHIAVPITIFFIISAGMLGWGFVKTDLQPLLVPVLFLGGWLFFTLLEYTAHRFLFHMPTDTPRKQKIQYKMHGIHHEFPKDKDRLAMPPPASILLACFFFSILYPLMHEKTFAFLPGMMTGYATYLFVHYIIHVYPPPQNFFKILWLNHSIHHYRVEENIVFGVSSPIWDYVFGTMPPKKK
jgi:sterol desaturase/sphingolipid hydroxylase (fatty acid hydroxylase superfamily)